MNSIKRTFFLNNLTWDITLDKSGNIRTIDEGLAAATSVSNAIQLFTNDAYFDQDRGIPHFIIDLGNNISISVIRNRYRQAALSVQGIKEATPNIRKNKREIKGNIEITTDSGETATVLI